MKKAKPIPPEQRPALIERVRQLNAEGKTDPQIARELGYSYDTIRHLRHEGKIPAVRGAFSSGPAKGTVYPHERICPTCTSPVDVARDVIDPHKAFFGRIGRGAVHGHLIPVADVCPASGGSYTRLLVAKAKEMSCAA